MFVGSVAQAGGIDNTVAFLQNIPGFLSGTQIANPILDENGLQVVQDGMPLFGAATDYGIVTIYLRPYLGLRIFWYASGFGALYECYPFV